MADFLAGGQFVEHVDQGFVGTLRLEEKPLADGQAAFFHRAVKVKQGFAQLIHRVQIGQMGALSQRGQLIQQRAEFLSFARMLLPAFQQVFGIQQDVHALGQEVIDQLRITLDPQARVRGVEYGFQAFGKQCPGAFDHPLGTLNGLQRVALQLLQALAQQPLGLQQQLDLIQVQCNQVRLVLAGQLIQWRRQLGNRQYAGHRCAALEGVQRALQFVAGLQRHMFRSLVEKAVETGEVALRFVAKDLQQLRIGRGGTRPNKRLRGPCPPGQAVGTGGQAVDIVTLALGIAGELGHQFRQQLQHVTQQVLHLWTGFDTVFQHPIEQVFHGPGQFTQHQCANHAPTAFQGVERAPQFAQRRGTVGVGRPARQVLAQDVQHLVGLLEEHFPQLVIHRRFVARRRQQTARRYQGRRIDGRHRARQHVGQRLHGLRVGQRLQIRHQVRVVGVEYLIEHRHMNVAGHIAERRQALLGHIEQLFTEGLRVFVQAFQVILDAGDGIGQAVELLPVRRGLIHQQVLANVAVAGFEQARPTAQRDHRQRPPDLGQQGRQRL
ncbi:hypothetical protein D3C85_591550 [compost metagenome]